MLMLKYLVMIVGFALFGSAAALVGYDIFLSAQLRKLLRRKPIMRSAAASSRNWHSGGFLVLHGVL